MTELLPFQMLQKQISSFIRDPDNVPMPDNLDVERLQVYKELLFNNLTETISNAFPVCYSILSTQQFEALVRGFYKDFKSSSPFFHHIPQNFLAFLNKLPHSNEFPPFLFELAHYEWVELALDLYRESPVAYTIDAEGDLLTEHPVFSECAWVLSYHYPVHKIGKNYLPEKPEPEPIFFIIYRNAHLQVEFMRIGMLTAHLIHLLKKNECLSGKDALMHLAKASRARDYHRFIEAGLNDLKSLKQQSIILGTRSI